MAWSINTRSVAFVFWDSTGNQNAIAPYQCVSLADSTEVAAALAAGVRDAVLGRVVVQTPVSGSQASRRIIGVTSVAARSGTEVSVTVEGVAEVMVNSAVAFDSRLTVAAASTRTNRQTPLTNLDEMLIAHDPLLTTTYNLALADDTAITVATTGANALYNYLGFALQAATAQYDVIPVQLAAMPFYA